MWSSSTRHGEFFIKYQVAKEVCTRIEYLNKSIVEASQEIIDELEQIEAYGGIIAIDYDANIAMPFNTDGMIRGGITNKRKFLLKFIKGFLLHLILSMMTLTLTDLHSLTLPALSIKNVDLSTPKYCFPYIDFIFITSKVITHFFIWI